MILDVVPSYFAKKNQPAQIAANPTGDTKPVTKESAPTVLEPKNSADLLSWLFFWRKGVSFAWSKLDVLESCSDCLFEISTEVDSRCQTF